MLQLFRKNLFVYNIFLLLYCCILRVSWIFIDIKTFETDHGGILSRYLYEFVGQGLLIKLFAIGLLVFQAIQINRLVSLNRLMAQNSLFAGVFYLLLASMTIEFIPLHPQLLANTFIIMMFLDVFRQTRNVQLHLDMFNVGLWVGLASLFYFPFIIYLPIGIVGVIYLRTYKWVDTVRAIIGLGLPYFMLGTILLLTDRLPDLYELHFNDSLAFLDLATQLSWKNYVVIGIFAMMILTSVAYSRSFSTGVNIHVRKKLTVIFIILAGSVLLMALVPATNISSLLFLVFPMSFLTAAVFLELEPQFAEVLHFLLLFTALAFQYIV